MDYSESFAKAHVEKWINAWNNHDLKTVLSLYSDNIEFSSPKSKSCFLNGSHQKLPTNRS